ncbi:MAG: lipoyl(octanoyl) transferase LipB [Acidobacteria bacterium]|nr:lipoyl(octanoyl) transferase LipB [Acidobacteriota bacterium]MYH31333.1 lipoyl(octanoyl) transferase LipB [Acidobacteriota bacterium]MYK88025.1 lipoyl(octanoyl) transferase LipB [Acidobacteriota bacterium]
MRPARTLRVRRLGLVRYADAVELQRTLVSERQRDAIADQLLLLEHPPVITRGVRAGADNVLAPPDVLRRRGVEVHDARRGGDVTYHGPGQLVGYPILLLKPDRCDVHRYVRDLEEVLIRAVAGFGVRATRIEGFTGVWVGNDKLAAIGVRLSRWVTSHGFALNVATDLDDFALIRPCGLADRGVTSLARLTGTKISDVAVADRVARRFAEVFDREIVAD